MAAGPKPLPPRFFDRPAAEPDWRAWHIFLRSPAALERLLTEAVIPETAGLRDSAGSQFFFIRYWENGPHVRLRIRGLDDEAFAACGERLHRSAAAIARDEPAGPDSFGAGMRFDGWHQDPSALPWFAPGSVVEILYEPEVRRYGGPAALRINEALFEESSALALQTVAGTAIGSGKRQAFALLLTAAAIRTVIEADEGIRPFLDGMAAGWRNFVTDPEAEETRAAQLEAALKPRLEALKRSGPGDPSENPVISAWRDSLRRHFDALEALAGEGLLVDPSTGAIAESAEARQSAIRAMLLSQIHMNNNRLGIAPAQEYGFARTLLLSHFGSVGEA